VDISKYEQEIQKIEMDESEKQERKKHLESAKTRLTDYREKFQQL